ncbi:MAG: hypothetical protein FWD13_09620 [Treponema sp.]|nr:hypothetical protein [Treponema sp.]
MWSEERLIKHELIKEQIIKYVQKHFFWGYEGIGVDEICITVANIMSENEMEESIIEEPISTNELITRKYQNLNKMIKEYQQEEIKIKKSKDNLQRPFIQKLISEGLLYDDGIRATGKLDNIAEFLVDELKMEISFLFLKSTFLQDSYKVWGKTSIEIALKHGNLGQK